MGVLVVFGIVIFVRMRRDDTDGRLLRLAIRRKKHSFRSDRMNYESPSIQIFSACVCMQFAHEPFRIYSDLNGNFRRILILHRQ